MDHLWPLDGFPEPDKSFDIKGVNNGYWGGRRWEISTPILAEKRTLGNARRRKKKEEERKEKEERKRKMRKEKEEAGKCKEEKKEEEK